VVCVRGKGCGIKMSSNISKWFPRVSTQQVNDKVFHRTRTIERELKILAKKFSTNINFNLLDYYVSDTPPIYIISCECVWYLLSSVRALFYIERYLVSFLHTLSLRHFLLSIFLSFLPL
jgi:hypothetical protein